MKPFLGLNSYRFSIGWSRVLPNGVGEKNQAGVDYYNNLINELLAHDIEVEFSKFLPRNLSLVAWDQKMTNSVQVVIQNHTAEIEVEFP